MTSRIVEKLLDMKYINLQSKSHKVYVVAESNGKVNCNRKEALLWELFGVEKCPSDPAAIVLRSAFDKYMTVDGPKSVSCRANSPSAATPIYPVMCGGGGSDNSLMMHFRTKNMLYFSAQRNGTTEWNRKAAMGFETFIVSTRCGASKRFSLKNYLGLRLCKGPGNAAKCTSSTPSCSALVDVNKRKGRATISFIEPRSGGALDFLYVDPGTGVVSCGPQATVFNYVMLDNNLVALQAPSNGKFVTSDQSGNLKASADALDTHEIFYVQPTIY